MPEVLCLGNMVADLVARPLRAMPERGRLVLVDRTELHPGGCAVNTAIALARLGCSVGVAGKVGCDALGTFLVESLVRAGVDTRGVVRDPDHATSATMVLVDQSGERSFIHSLGANSFYRLADFDLRLLNGIRILHVAGALVLPSLDGQPMAELLARARHMGVTTSLDTVWDASGRWMELLAPCLPHVDLFLPSLPEAAALSGLQEPRAIADFFLDRGVGTVALKMGDQGSYVKRGDMELPVPAFPVDAVDGTGAGDCFVAGFLAGELLGWDLERTVTLANAVGACAVTSMGATSGVMGLSETEEWIRQQKAAAIRRLPADDRSTSEPTRAGHPTGDDP